MEARLAELLSMLPGDRAPGRPGHLAARRWLVETLRARGLAPVERPVRWAALPTLDLANIEVALGAAASEGASRLLLTAHYDTVPGSGGADDNGVAVAALVLLAERLAGRRADSEVRLVWFDGEEQGLLGSGRYVLDLTPEERSRTLGVINLECVGFTDRRPGSQRLPEGVREVFDPGDVGDFLLVVGNLDSGALVRTVAQALERHERHGVFRVESFGWLPGRGFILPDVRRSDHAPFWDAGIPAVLLTDTADFRNPHYHRPSDAIETLDLPFASALVMGLEALVIERAGVD